MMTMRAQLAPALLLLLVLLAAATPLVPALTPQEIRDRKINGANKLYIMGVDPDTYAGGEKKSTPDSKKETPKDAVQKTSYVMGAGVEPKPESKSDEKVLEAKINAEVKAMRKEAAYDDAVAENKAKEFKGKPKNTTDDAEDQAIEKKSKSKSDSSEDDAVEKKSKSKVDYSADGEKKPKNKDDDSEEKKSKSKVDYSEDADGEKKEKKPKSKDDDSEEKKSKSKSESSEDIDDEKKEKKSKSKNDDDYAEKKLKSKDDDDEKKEKKSKSKEEDSTDDSEKKSKSKSDAYEKKSKEKSESSEDAGDKKKSKSKNKEEDFDAVPIESKADESVPAAEPTKKTPPAADGYQAPTTTTMSAADTPDGYLPPKKAEPKMSAADTPDGYAAPKTMSAADTPDGYVTPSKAQPAMSAADTPDGYVPATDSPNGNVPASDSPDGYAAPSTKPKVTVQSFSEMVPQSVLQMLSPKVKSLCSKTSFPYTCQTSIARLPETTVVPARQKEGLGVLTLAVDAVRAKLVEAKNAAKDLAVDPHTDKISKGAISDCLQMYDDISTSYDTALLALKRGDRGAATSAVDAARTFVDTCDQGFLDRQGLKPVMADQDKVLAQLTSNVIAINKFMY